MSDATKMGLEEFLKLESLPFAMGSHSAKDPSWETRHPGILNSYEYTTIGG